MLLPVALSVENRAVLLVGGGAVAARKATAFLEAGALVTVVSPQLQPDFPAVHHRAKRYETADLDGFSLVCACTAAREVNAQVAADAKARNIWCNIADAPAESDFHTSSVIRRGEIAVGVSTSGISPVLARFVRQKVEASLPQSLEILLEMTRSYDIPTEIRGDFWRHLLDSKMLPLIENGELEAARALLENLLDSLIPERGE
ncbi:MAG TPA: bifunctional precorrin-2 dehydrogenase/sirohydrochlorin ferrochelatase [Abditibacterium sp.]